MPHTNFPHWHWIITSGCAYLSTLFWVRSVVWFVFNANFTIKSGALYEPNTIRGQRAQTRCLSPSRKREGVPDLHINPSHPQWGFHWETSLGIGQSITPVKKMWLQMPCPRHHLFHFAHSFFSLHCLLMWKWTLSLSIVMTYKYWFGIFLKAPERKV